MDRAALDVIAARIAEQAAFNRTITDPLQAQEYARETAQAQRILAAHLSVLHLQQQHNILKMEQKIAEMKPSKSDINSVIMDYLISEGYPGAAEKFANETNLFQGEAFDVESIRERVQIRNAILSGHIEDAIELLNNDETLILDVNPLLHFKLMQLQLVEIIRTVLEKNNGKPASADFRPALEFATTQLSPRAPTDPKYLSALEKTMALMIFDADKMIPEMKELLDLQLRETVAGEVNKAILQSKGMQPEARIRELVRARAWAEAQAKSLDILPPNTDIGLDGDNVVDTDAMVTG